MKNQFTLLFIFLSLSFFGFSQTEKEIDEIFSEINDSSRPAVAALIIHKGEVVYKKGFGNEHLDYESPTTPDTKFQLAGLSKHFTAFAIFLLEEQGELSFDDDIRKHIPELPEYDQTITIQHLLSQSSGLHGYWSLRPLTGMNYPDVFTHQQALKLIGKQQELGFEPGSDYSYGNTGQTLLAEIIERVSGQSFSTYAKESLFDPLGMSNTLFKDSFEQYIPNTAHSYEAVEGGFQEAPSNFGIVGPTNLFSTIEDLSKWELNMVNPKIGSKEMIEKMNSPAQLNDGTLLSPSYGTITLGHQLIHAERGVPKIYQTGTLGGYNSSIFKFLDQEFTVIVLSSGIPYNGYLGMGAAYLFLEDQFTGPASIDFQSLKSKKLSAKKLQKHEGTYWNWKGASARSIAVRADTLRYVRGPGNDSPLIPLSDNRFQMISPGDENIYVTFKVIDGQKRMEFNIEESDPLVFSIYEPVTYNSNELSQFTGTFHCKELSTVYQFDLKEDRLTASQLRNEDVTFTPIKTDLFDASAWYFGAIKYQRNSAGTIQGFWIQMDEVRNLWFEKIS